MQDSFWQKLPQPFFILAPMEAVTDIIFRHVVAEAGSPDIWFSEFTNATGWTHAGQKAIGGRLVKSIDEDPIVAQIWGGNPNDMQNLASYCRELGFHGIDINMGCPAKSAIKSGGAALIRNPELAIESIKAAKTANLPVSVKTRLGYSNISEYKNWISTLLKQDIVNLTVHLRTKKEMSKVPAHFELIDEIVKLRNEISPQTLLTINGDIKNRTHGEEIVKNHPGVNGIMIGRGIFTDPFCFRNNPKNTEKTQNDLVNLLRIHLGLFDQWQPQTGRPFETLKRFFKIYIKGFDGAKEKRELLMQCKSTDEARKIIDSL